MVFYKYYLEIKNRLLLVLLTWITTALASYYYKEILLFIIIKPTMCYWDKQIFFAYFIFTDATEIFSVFIHIIFFFCNQALILNVTYHTLIFFLPGLLQTEYYFVKFLLKNIVLIFFMIVVTINLVLLPLSWNFFLSFQKLVTLKSITLHFEAKLSEYINFYLEFYYICILYCQFFIFFVVFFYFLKSNIFMLKKVRKPIFCISIAFSTIVTPPDVISQFVVSTFILFSYESLAFNFIVKSNAKSFH